MDQKEINQEQPFSDQAVTVSVGMKVRYMYAFLFQHVHRSFQGIFGVCLSLAALVLWIVSLDGMGITTQKVILLVIGLMFTVINPLMILVKAWKQVTLSPVFKQPLQYTFGEEGLQVAQGDEEQFVTWNQVREVRKTATILVLYTTKASGSILAWKELGDKRQEVERIIANGCRAAGVTKVPASMKRADAESDRGNQTW